MYFRGNETLAGQIKSRRSELGLTIEEAASRAGVGTKTWCRYEAGESIRRDKCKGICKALNWLSLPNQDREELIIYLCSEESSALIELGDEICGIEDDYTADPNEWVFDLFDDMDIITFLYSNMYLNSNHPYHFSHWTDQQFYMD